MSHRFIGRNSITVLCLVTAACSSGPQWLDRQASGDSIFYTHSTSGVSVAGVNSDAIAYCSARGKSAVLGSRTSDGYLHFNSNYLCR